MDHTGYVDALRRESTAFSAGARRAGVGAPMPSCPGWTVGDLGVHVGRLHRWVADLVVNRPADPLRARAAVTTPSPADDDLVDWFDAGVAPVADALLAAGPDAPAWSWTADATAGFWARRQANEIAVHRWDAQLAAGDPQPIARELAVDAIDELFGLIPFWRGADAVRGRGETLHFHCTDGDGEWLARLDSDGVVVTREHAKGDVAARGSASDLLLVLYGRLEPGAVEVLGDGPLLARWRELVSW